MEQHPPTWFTIAQQKMTQTSKYTVFPNMYRDVGMAVSKNHTNYIGVVPSLWEIFVYNEVTSSVTSKQPGGS